MYSHAMSHYARGAESRAYASDDESLLRHRIFRRRIDAVRNKHGRPGSRRYRRHENNIMAHMHQDLDDEDKIVPQCPYEMKTYFLDVGMEFFHNPESVDDICPNKKSKKLPKISEYDSEGPVAVRRDDIGDGVPSCGDDEGAAIDDPLAVAQPTTSRASSLSMWELVEDPSKGDRDGNMPGSGDNDEIGADDEVKLDSRATEATNHGGGGHRAGSGGGRVLAPRRDKDFYPELAHWSDVQLFAMRDRVARTNFRLVTRCLRPLLRKHKKSLFLYEIDRVLCAFKSVNKDACMAALRDAMTFHDLSTSDDIPQDIGEMARTPGAPEDAMPSCLILELKDALSRLLIGGVCQFYGLVCADHRITKDDELVNHITVVECPPAALHAADAHHFEVLPPSLRLSLCDHLNSTQAT